MKKLPLLAMIMLLLAFATGCKTIKVDANAQAAPWLNQLIQKLQEEQPANPPAKIYRYTYNNQEVYYLTGRCCDIPSQLFDKDGKQLCEPDGGITGKGDGRCSDFFEKRQNETLIWKDKRER